MLVPLVLTNARIVDATGERAGSVHLEGDRIVAVGDVVVPPGSRVLDLDGATVVPGLVDCHVHLALTPSGTWLELSEEEEVAGWRHHLRAYVASGVTTVLDTGIPLQDAIAMRELATQGPSPDIHGPLVSPDGGYVNVVIPEFPPTRSAEELQAHIDAFAPLEPVGIKITVESGMLGKIWPTYTEEVEAALKAKSTTHRLFAHAIDRKEHERALDLGIAGFVHPPFKPRPETVERIGAAKMPVVSTLSVIAAQQMPSHPGWTGDPLVRLTVPAHERRAAADVGVQRLYAEAVTSTVMPKAPGFVRKPVQKMVLKGGKLLDKRIAQQMADVKALHDAGAPIVMGSDSGNWEIFPFFFHGPTSLDELGLLQDAGLTPMEVLTAATLRGAEMIGIDDQIGTIEAGKRADLLVVDGDPLQDITVLRELTWVVRNGEIRTPSGWMSGK